ncbi:MAG: hypothetical protein J7K33_03715 [Candidatus Marinimicrobia bacterium]|nr:hypothetical protein [Candidatus Neomarinimicrobiota bacterium]
MKGKRIVPFTFNKVKLKEACWIKDVPYFTRKAIGEWLGYEYPQKAIDKIIERNPYIRQFSVTVKLTVTDGKQYQTEVYNPIGLQLIVMESHQPKAIEYKIAVAKLVYAYMRGDLKFFKTAGNLADVLALPKGMRGRGRAVETIAQKLGICRATAYRHLSRLEAGLPIRMPRRKKRISKYEDRYLEARRFYFEENLTGKEIAERLNVPISTVYFWINKKFREAA